jgi:predicted Rossmann fold nucleotide-binding protein DprA/Smf involved in DNA uptake
MSIRSTPEYPQTLLQIYDPRAFLPARRSANPERPEAEQRDLLAFAALGASEKKLYQLLVVEETRHIDELLENSGLNSSEVLATLFDLEMKGVVRQLSGKQFSKVML